MQASPAWLEPPACSSRMQLDYLLNNKQAFNRPQSPFFQPRLIPAHSPVPFMHPPLPPIQPHHNRPATPTKGRSPRRAPSPFSFPFAATTTTTTTLTTTTALTPPPSKAGDITVVPFVAFPLSEPKHEILPKRPIPRHPVDYNSYYGFGNHNSNNNNSTTCSMAMKNVPQPKIEPQYREIPGPVPKIQKKRRRRLSTDELFVLEAFFTYKNSPDTDEKNKLSDVLHMTPQQVSNWFQNKRSRVRRDGEGRRDSVVARAAVLHAYGILKGLGVSLDMNSAASDFARVISAEVLGKDNNTGGADAGMRG